MKEHRGILVLLFYYSHQNFYKKINYNICGNRTHEPWISFLHHGFKNILTQFLHSNQTYITSCYYQETNAQFCTIIRENHLLGIPIKINIYNKTFQIFLKLRISRHADEYINFIHTRIFIEKIYGSRTNKPTSFGFPV